MLKRVVDKDGNMSGAKLAEVISIIDVSTDGLQALLHKYGVEGIGSSEAKLPVWKLMELLEKKRHSLMSGLAIPQVKRFGSWKKTKGISILSIWANGSRTKV